MKAIFQGEFHTSKSDWESLKETISDEDVDAVFIENRPDNIGPEKWNLGYLSFLTGAFTIFWIQRLISRQPENPEFDIPVHEEIDIALPALYRLFKKSWKIVGGALGMFVFALGLFRPVYPVPFIDTPDWVVILNTAILKPIMIIGAPLLFTFVLIYLEQRKLGYRDKKMSEEINRISRKNGYDVVAVSCGDAHLERLPNLLEDKGWEVDPKDSNLSFLTRIWK